MNFIQKKIQKIEHNQLLKKGIIDSGFYGLSVLFGRSLTILVVPYLVLKLTLEEVAYYDLFLIGVNYIQLFLTLGIDSGIAIKIADHKDDKQNLTLYFSLSLAIVFALGFATLLIGISILFFFQNYDLSFIILLLVQSFLCAIQYVSYSYFKWLGESKKASLLMSIGYGLGVILGLVLLNIFEATLVTFIIGLVIGNLIGVIVTSIVSYKYINFSFDRNSFIELKILLKLSLPFFYNSLINQTYKAVDRFIVLSLFNVNLLGVYSLIVRICQIPIMALELILSTFQARIFVNYKTREGKKLYNNILKVSFVLTIVLLTLFSISVQLFQPYIGVLDTIGKYTYLVPFVYLNISFISIRILGGFSYFIHKKTIYLTYLSLASIVVYFLLVTLLQSFGILGIVISAALASILHTLAYYYLGNKIESFNENLKSIYVFSICNLLIAIILTIVIKTL
jgi:O-antigen/teichoic acid export membrane protein